MSRSWMMRLATLLVLLLLCGAVGLTVYTVKQTETCRQTLTLRERDLEGLAAVQADLATYTAAREVFERCQMPPPPLSVLMSGSLAAGQTPEMRDLSEAGPTGWTRRRHELSFDQTSIADVLALVQAAEVPIRDAAGNQRPGWRLAQCAIRPMPGRPGVGRVVVVLEALVRE